MSDLPPDEQYRRRQAAEYGTFVANKPIYIRGARAFNKGNPVPVSHVERGVVAREDVDAVEALEQAVTVEPATEGSSPEPAESKQSKGKKPATTGSEA